MHVIKPIDELMGEAIEDEDIENDLDAVVGADPSSTDTIDPEAPTDQGGLFDAPQAVDDGSDDDDEPSPEDIEAAAEHFSGSIHVDEGPDDEPIDDVVTVVTQEPATTTGADLFADIHGGDVEDDILSDLDADDGAPRTVVVGAEGLGGPSWQEPTSVEVGADLDRRGPGEGERDVPAAFLTMVTMPFTFSITEGIAFGFIAYALLMLCAGRGREVHPLPATAVGLVTGALMIAGAYYHGEAGILAMFSLGVVATFLWFIAAPPHTAWSAIRTSA